MRGKIILAVIVVMAGIGILIGGLMLEILPERQLSFLYLTGQGHVQHGDDWVNYVNNDGIAYIDGFDLTLQRNNQYERSSCYTREDGYCLAYDDYGDVDEYGCPIYHLYWNGHDDTCGGHYWDLRWGCGYKLTVAHENGTVLHSDERWRQAGADPTGMDMGDNTHIAVGYNYYFVNYVCRRVEGDILYTIPEGSFEVNITTPEPYYYRGDDALVDILVTNNWRDNVEIDTISRICQPVFWGQSCVDYLETSIVDQGTSAVSYSIPTAFVTERLTVTPSLDVYFPDGLATGVNIECNPDNPYVDKIEDCSGLLSIGRFTGQSSDIEIRESLIACLTDDDCDSPCAGMTAYCGSDSRCHFTGECIGQPVPDVWEELTITWNNFWTWVINIILGG